MNAIDRYGNHPLHLACQSLAEELFEKLIRAGSDPRLASGIATRAAWGGRTDILAYLNLAGFDLNEPDSRGTRPIDAAVGMGYLPTVEYLLGESVDTTTVDVSKPLKPWKGALPNKGVLEKIRERIIAKRSERAAKDSGPASP